MCSVMNESYSACAKESLISRVSHLYKVVYLQECKHFWTITSHSANQCVSYDSHMNTCMVLEIEPGHLNGHCVTFRVNCREKGESLPDQDYSDYVDK